MLTAFLLSSTDAALPGKIKGGALPFWLSCKTNSDKFISIRRSTGQSAG
jgi:hypothetical protein